jgi:hypothetical protein
MGCGGHGRPFKGQWGCWRGERSALRDVCVQARAVVASTVDDGAACFCAGDASGGLGATAFFAPGVSVRSLMLYTGRKTVGS